MSWNNQGGGPWGGGNNQGPWSQGPKKPNGGGNGSGGPTPPDLDELLRKGQESMKKFIPGGFGPGGAIAVALVVIVGVWLLSGFYKVESKQQGVEMLFGKYVRTTQAGLHWKLPYPIGDVIIPDVTSVREISIGTGGSARSNTTGEGLILTSDQNIVDVDYKVLWVIKDAAKYLFNIRDAETIVRTAAQSAMREVIGQRKLSDVNTSGRDIVATEARELIQSILDSYDAGILIQRVNMAKIDPPQAVIEAFNDVQAARQDKVRKQNEAETYRNRILPTARGEAQKILQDAEAYKERVIKDAEGEAKRFVSVYESYLINKDVTRERLFLETMQEVLKKSDKVLIDNEGGNGGVVPYLALPELQKNKGAK